MGYEAIVKASANLTRVEQLNLLAYLANLIKESEENDCSLEKAVSDSRNMENLYGPFDSAQAAVESMLED
jgi:hypothetical protein